MTDAQLLVKYRKIAEFFEAASDGTANPKVASNFILGQIFRRLDNDTEKENFAISISAKQLKELICLIDQNKIRMNLAKSILEKMLDSGKSVHDLISENDLGGIDDETMQKLCQEAIASNQNAVNDYLNGKEKALKALLGYVMKATKGRADASAAEKTLISLIKKS